MYQEKCEDKVANQLSVFLKSDIGKTALTILKKERESVVFTSPTYQPQAYIDGDGVWAMALDFKKRMPITVNELVALSVESDFILAEDLPEWFFMSLGLIAQRCLLKKHAVKESIPH
ncbi:MAG: hypothetical protein A2750_01305 [Candidatus Yanofskybacteria bacterium RIFCSPHIGHO2_01_FULL_45_42]|uniref:Uncharacterized protein n=3 Tax=Candidatus Yanofskyibacteriota TaxID=1752733 RepID=A0A1F8H4V9_9BACT|nr:MAG: hypothetical protein A2750_01305 [Candidatus Yanofskybacteria bacterium RIFCSPHIGHO2_01_FULL_45_42]OGN16605.1 MAG: hypothetical protein A3C81_02460 [Candidatus Yanofskybacteria bacterium RIFCSPHIGHO2_02_FULL_46_19]OGN26577.1 MAG: hypothetical protein A3B17_00795 [Candidatus Yanofskybacteria bacterium RIFCSPLOWO2_01_FULL_45_72]OGN32633.1 MAG: hypothetical protein A3J01_01580 [Candidatus Yanofskybacteria bacterium RIFCSPLOWO2_02_FULL_45_18]